MSVKQSAKWSGDLHDKEQVASLSRLALRRLASGVSVVTCKSGDEFHAMTATAISALSMEPPSMLVCVNRRAVFHRAIETARHFAINILTEAQAEVSAACGGGASGDAKFAYGEWDMDGLSPELIGAQATLHCEKNEARAFGSHTIFIGNIASVSFSERVNPLVYCDGKYTSLSANL